VLGANAFAGVDETGMTRDAVEVRSGSRWPELAGTDHVGVERLDGFWAVSAEVSPLVVLEDGGRLEGDDLRR